MHRIMFVDDEALVLSSFRRTVGSRFDCVFAQGAAEALSELCQDPGIAVIVTDMRMPGMDGITFIQQARQVAPQSSYIMLTGNADLETAIGAVNRGEVFRFLNKPCPPETLQNALNAALRQYELIQSEQTLLQKTLTGSVRLLTEMLSLGHPHRAEVCGRVRRCVRALVQCMDLPDPWAHEVAALLSQIGRFTLPEHLQEAEPAQLTDPQDQQLLRSHPQRAAQMLANIPRLERSGRMVAQQLTAQEPGDEPRRANANPDGDTAVAWGACVLRVALKFAEVYPEAGDEMSARQYTAGMLKKDCPKTTEALLSMAATECENAGANLRVLNVSQLQPGMLTAAPVSLCNGRPLLGRGRELNELLIAQLQTHAERGVLAEPLDLLVPQDLEDTDPVAQPQAA